MTEQKMDVFSTLIEGKVDDLAATSTPKEIQKIVDDAKTQADEIFQKLGNPIDWDPVIYRVTVIVLGSVAIIVVLAQAVLAYCVKDANIPEGLVAIGAAAIGALAGLLAPTSGSKQG